MISWLLLVLRAVTGMDRSRVSLAAENANLRQQLSVLQREQPRPLLRPPSAPRPGSSSMTTMGSSASSGGVGWERFCASRACPSPTTTKAALIRESTAYRSSAPACRELLGLRPKAVLSGSWRAWCSAAFTTITDSLRSSDPPVDLVAGPNRAGLFWFRPPCRVLTPTGQEMSLPVTR